MHTYTFYMDFVYNVVNVYMYAFTDSRQKEVALQYPQLVFVPANV